MNDINTGICPKCYSIHSVLEDCRDYTLAQKYEPGGGERQPFVKSGCMSCANGNDLPDGEVCRICNRIGYVPAGASNVKPFVKASLAPYDQGFRDGSRSREALADEVMTQIADIETKHIRIRSHLFVSHIYLGVSLAANLILMFIIALRIGVI